MGELTHILLCALNMYAAGLCFRVARFSRIIKAYGWFIFLILLFILNMFCAMIQGAYLW